MPKSTTLGWSPVSLCKSAVTKSFTSLSASSHLFLPILSKSNFSSQPLSPAAQRQNLTLSYDCWPWELVGANNWEERARPGSSCTLALPAVRLLILAHVPGVHGHCSSTNTNKNSRQASTSPLGTACSKGTEQCFVQQQLCLLLDVTNVGGQQPPASMIRTFSSSNTTGSTQVDSQWGEGLELEVSARLNKLLGI